MKTMQEWFDAYGESHQNPTNKLFHWICVPTIFFSLIGMLMLLKIPVLNTLVPTTYAPIISLGGLVILGGLFFFARLSVPITLGISIVASIVFWGNIQLMQLTTTSFFYTQLGLFAAAWVGQFIGHKIEGKKPSFFDDLKFLMIGPAWLLSFIYKKMGIKY